MANLTKLNISQTDIEEGLENLPESLLVLECDPFIYSLGRIEGEEEEEYYTTGETTKVKAI